MENLNEKEKKIVDFLLSGNTYDFIKKELGVSTKTIAKVRKKYISIEKKLRSENNDGERII